MTTEIITNDRFDRLTNLDISTHYRDKDFYLMKSDFLGALARWLVTQSPYNSPDITKALEAFNKHIDTVIMPKDNHLPHLFTYDSLSKFINSDVFESIPEIEIFNHSKIDTNASFVFTNRFSNIKPDYDFIDLGALARNVFYMLMREYITQS